MALDQQKKEKRDVLVGDYEGKIKDKQNLLVRLNDNYAVEVAKVQIEIEELILKRDGLKGLK